MKVSPFLAILALCGLAACATQPPAETALPSFPRGGEPGNVAGMDGPHIRSAFGIPQFVRKDGQIEMWRYDGANCKAFFFLYPTGTSLAVKHVETLPHGTDAAADSTCLAALLAHAKAAPPAT